MQAGFGDAFHIVSVAYRYIPQVGLKEMVEDCTDAFDWCRARLPTLLPDIDYATDTMWNASPNPACMGGSIAYGLPDCQPVASEIARPWCQAAG
jgi:hypothetical protein